MEIRSEVLGDVNVNTSRQYTQTELQQFDQAGKLLGDNRFDFIGPGTHRNYDLIDDFFQNNRQLPVTLDNIYRAVEARKSEFASLTPAQHAWYTTSQANQQLANDLANYIASTSGRPGQLVKDGSDLHFQNLLTLFQEINGRGESATSQSIAHAQDRILRQAGKGTLHYVPQPRRTEPMSRAAKEDALENPNRKPGQLFSGDMVRTSDGGWRNKNAAEQAADRRGAEEAQESPSVIRGREQAAAEQEAEAMRGSTHSESDQLQKLFVYDRVNQQIDWSATRNARRVMQATFERRRSIR